LALTTATATYTLPKLIDKGTLSPAAVARHPIASTAAIAIGLKVQLLALKLPAKL